MDPNYNEAIVVSFDITENVVKRILVDNDSLVNILFKHIMDMM